MNVLASSYLSVQLMCTGSDEDFVHVNQQKNLIVFVMIYAWVNVDWYQVKLPELRVKP